MKTYGSNENAKTITENIVYTTSGKILFLLIVCRRSLILYIPKNKQ